MAAIGSPFGEEQSLSVGVVSALDRDDRLADRVPIAGAIQTDAAINRGNSGGPLVDARGRVIGINSQIKSSSGGGEGVGFAVPVDTVRRSLAQLRETGEVDYAFLGVHPSRSTRSSAEASACRSARRAGSQKVTRRPADEAGSAAATGKIFQARAVPARRRRHRRGRGRQARRRRRPAA